MFNNRGGFTAQASGTTTAIAPVRPATDSGGRYRIALPESSRCYAQDREWFLVELAEGWREIRFHDYAEIYRLPGLYEQLFYEVLRCDSPRFVADLLGMQLGEFGREPAELRVLDLGAGNGMMGERLQALGVDSIIGLDVLTEAATATARDRPGVYRAYHTVDLTALSPSQHRTLRGHACNALTCIAALGFADIPPDCFQAAINLIDDDGWLAFTLKEEFFAPSDPSGFHRLIQNAAHDGHLEILTTQRYRHRLATTGAPLSYTAVIARKRSESG